MRRLLALFLLIVLFVLAPKVRAESAATLPPPTYDIPFDDYDEATTQAAVAQEVLIFLLTAQSYWGQNQTTLREAVPGHLVQDGQGKLIYSRMLANHGVLEGYDFRDGSLVRGQYLFLQRPINRLNEFIDYYNAVKRALTDSYGTPTQDQVLWENDLYQPLPDYWGVAVMIGYLRYAATWETSEGTIAIALTGDRHSKLMVDYRSRTFLEHEPTAGIVAPRYRRLNPLELSATVPPHRKNPTFYRTPRRSTWSG